MDARVPVSGIMAALGVPATVTRPAPDNTPITTTGVWFSGGIQTSREALSSQPFGTDLRRTEPRRLFAIPRTVLDTLPRGTQISAPETLGGSVKTWRVDGISEGSDPELWQAIVIPSPQ